MPWGVAAAVGASVAGAAVSSAMAPSPSDNASAAASAADPFSSQRGQYQSMLSDLIKNPSSITSQPGYEFNLDQGLKSVQGSAAANGMLNSGNVLTSLQQYGSNYAQNQLQNQELLLAQLAGANVGSPGTAGQILQNQNQQNQASASALGNAVGGAVNQGIQGIGGYFGGSGYSGGNPFATDTSGYGAGANTYGFTTGSTDYSSGVSYGFGV